MKPGPGLDRTLAADDSSIVELADKIEASPLGEAGDGAGACSALPI